MDDAVKIEGFRGGSIPLLVNTGTQTVPLEVGQYAVSSDVDIWIRVSNKTEIGNRAQDVTGADGYRIFAGNVETVYVDNGRRIGAIAASAGTMFYHRIG